MVFLTVKKFWKSIRVGKVIAKIQHHPFMRHSVDKKSKKTIAVIIPPPLWSIMGKNMRLVNS